MAREIGRLRVSGRLLAHNTFYNLSANVFALAVGVVAIPLLMRRLGVHDFGLLTLGWVLLGYFGVADLGLSRAATKYVAEALGRGEGEWVAGIVWSAIGVQVLVGAAGTLVLALGTPLLMGRWLAIPPDSLPRAVDTFRWLSLALPVMLVTNTFQGALEGAQKFGPVAIVRLVATSSGFLAPLLVVWAGGDIRTVAIALVGTRVLLLVLAAVLFRATFPQAMRGRRIHPHLLRSFARFGSWITLSSLIGPLLVSADRWIVALILGSSAVASYAVPHETVLRLYVLPASFVAVLFPAYSALGSTPTLDAERLATRGMKYLLLTMGMCSWVLILFAKDILRVWVGAEMAAKGAPVLQIMSAGLLLHSLAYVPGSLLLGIGKPNVTTAFQMAQLPVHLGVAWVLTERWGLVGAALSWSIRAAVDFAYHLAVTMRMRFISRQSLVREHVVQSAGVLAVLGVLTGVLLSSTEHADAKAVAGLVMAAGFAAVVWRALLDPAERSLLRDVVSLSRRKESRIS